MKLELTTFGLLAILAGMASAADSQLIVNATFSVQGTSALSTPINYEAFVGAVPLQDGKVAAAGNFGTTLGSDLIIARFLSNGSLDTTFGLNGATIFDVGASDDSMRAIATFADGRIAVVGRSGGRALTAVVRADGTLDQGFAVGGIARTSVIGAASISLADLAVLPDGSLVAAGSVQLADGEHVLLLKYTPQGALDRTFDYDGVRIVREVQSADPRIRLLADGRLVVASRAVGQLHVVQLLSDGRLDMDFGNGGVTSLLAPKFTPMTAFEQMADGFLIAERTDGRATLISPRGEIRATQTLVPGSELSALTQSDDGRVFVAYETNVVGGRNTTLGIARLETSAPPTVRSPTPREVRAARELCLALRPGPTRKACRVAALRRITVPGAPMSPTWVLKAGLTLASTNSSVLAVDVSVGEQIYLSGFTIVDAQTDFLLVALRPTTP